VFVRGNIRGKLTEFRRFQPVKNGTSP
jgi:hypothetical protein